MPMMFAGLCRGAKGVHSLSASMNNSVIDGTDEANFAAVNDAVADSVDLFHGGYNAVLGAGKLVDNSGNRLSVGGHCNILIKYGLLPPTRGLCLR